MKEVTLSREKAKYFSNFAILSSEAGVWSKPFGKMTQKKRLAGRQQGRRNLFFALVAVIFFHFCGCDCFFAIIAVIFSLLLLWFVFFSLLWLWFFLLLWLWFPLPFQSNYQVAPLRRAQWAQWGPAMKKSRFLSNFTKVGADRDSVWQKFYNFPPFPTKD